MPEKNIWWVVDSSCWTRIGDSILMSHRWNHLKALNIRNICFWRKCDRSSFYDSKNTQKNISVIISAILLPITLFLIFILIIMVEMDLFSISVPSGKNPRPAVVPPSPVRYAWPCCHHHHHYHYNHHHNWQFCHFNPRHRLHPHNLLTFVAKLPISSSPHPLQAAGIAI